MAIENPLSTKLVKGSPFLTCLAIHKLRCTIKSPSVFTGTLGYNLSKIL